MTIRLGFVGVGRWARKLAESFRAVGAEVVAHDRSSPSLAGLGTCAGCLAGSGDHWAECYKAFGKRTHWRDQLTSKDIDAIIAVAPPDVTTQVALACAAAGKPVMATKPLWDHPERITAPFYVDFWRLWASIHQKMREECAFTTSDYSLCGSGPFRDFPGAFDYGPHVMAAMLDVEGLGSGLEFGGATRHECAQGELYTARFHSKLTGQTVFSTIGNGSPSGVRRVWCESETPTHIGTEPKDLVIQKMCRAFIADVQDGYVDTRLLSLSRDGMALLRKIREMAK